MGINLINFNNFSRPSIYIFKDTLTIPKVKDLVNQPSESYREIEKTLNSSNNNNDNNNNNNNNNNDSTNINDLKTNIDKNEMKNELKNFFDNLKNDTNNTNNTNNINNSFVKPTTYSELSNNINMNNYSEF